MTEQETVPLFRRVRPANGNNAIIQTAFLIEFTDRVSDADIAHFQAKISAFHKLGYSGLPVESVDFTILNQQAAAAKGNAIEFSSKRLAGHTFVRNPGTPAMQRQIKEITLRDSNLVLLADQYTRWANLWKEAEEVFNEVLPGLSRLRVKFVQLEYVDLFRVAHPDQKMPVPEVIADSKFVPANFRECSSHWHCHHGYLVDSRNKGFGKQLNNINVAYTVESAQDAIHMLTTLKYEDPHPDRHSNMHRLLADTFALAHGENKQILADLLTPAAKELIAFNSGDSNGA